MIDNSVLYALKQHLLRDDFVGPALGEYNKELSAYLESLDVTRPKLENRLSQIHEARRKLLLLMEKGVEPDAIEVRLLELDVEERSKKAQLEMSPKPMTIDPQEALTRYQEVIENLLSNTLEDNYAYKTEVMNAVRRLVEEVIIYPNDDPEGRDVEVAGTIEALCAPEREPSSSLGIEAMVPGGGMSQISCFKHLTLGGTL